MKTDDVTPKAIAILTRQAKAATPIPYGALAAEIGLDGPRPINRVMYNVGNALLSLEDRGVPPLMALAVAATDGLPSSGLYEAFAEYVVKWTGPLDEFEKLSKADRRIKMQTVYESMQGYPRWDWVAKQLGLPSVGPAPETEALLTRAGTIGERLAGTGEGPDHRALKEYIAAHPGVVGIKTTATAVIEQLFPSADRADVSFADKSGWTVVEVKPASAPEDDIVRGIFQCMKYQALMSAVDAVESRVRELQTILVLGGNLTDRARSLVNTLGLTVHENIRPPQGAKD